MKSTYVKFQSVHKNKHKHKHIHEHDLSFKTLSSNYELYICKGQTPKEKKRYCIACKLPLTS